MAAYIPLHEQQQVHELVQRRLIFMAYDSTQELEDDYSPKKRRSNPKENAA